MRRKGVIITAVAALAITIAVVVTRTNRRLRDPLLLRSGTVVAFKIDEDSAYNRVRLTPDGHKAFLQIYDTLFPDSTTTSANR